MDSDLKELIRKNRRKENFIVLFAGLMFAYTAFFYLYENILIFLLLLAFGMFMIINSVLRFRNKSEDENTLLTTLLKIIPQPFVGLGMSIGLGLAFIISAIVAIISWTILLIALLLLLRAFVHFLIY